MHTAATGGTEKKDREQGIDQQDIFDRMALFLAALARRLCSRVMGADDAPCGPIMGKREGGGVAAGTVATGAGSSARGATRGAASASATPNRWARAVRERVGASPRAGSATSSAGWRICI